MRHPFLALGQLRQRLFVTMPFSPILYVTALLNLLRMKSKGDDPCVSRATVKDEDA
jgi:hypothetical protein